MRLGPSTLALALVAGCHFSGAGVAADEPDAASAARSPDAAPGIPYPVVLAHGLFGFDNIAGVDYFYGISAALTANGRVVFTPRVDAIQSPEIRGAQLVGAIEDARKQTGAAKVIVIGHSQGGL